MRQAGRAEFAQVLVDGFTWRQTPYGVFADLSGWWRDAGVLAGLGPSLAGLHADGPPPTLVAGIETRGLMLGPLVAAALGVGFVEVRKERLHLGDGRRRGNGMLYADTPPDYRDGGLTLMAPERLFGPGDRVLLVDEWIDTGAQANAARRMVTGAGADWAGTAVVVDACDPRVRTRLDVRGLLMEDDLPA